MKITDMAILFVIITLPFYFILDIKTKNTQTAVYKKLEINRIIDTAVEDGVANLVESGGSKNVKINKEKAAQAFFNSLYLNFNIFEDSLARKRLEGYIPCLVAIDYDGYYIMNQQWDSVNSEMRMVWSPKKTYAYNANDRYVYYFTLDNFLTVYDKYSNVFHKGSVDQVSAEIYTDSDLLDNIVDLTNPSDPVFLKFDQVRRTSIVGCLQRDINFSINRHNDIARMFGITYTFALPSITKENWYKTVDDIGLLAFFQGLPVGATDERVNNYALGGARIVKTPKYYGNTNAASGLNYYHRESCLLHAAGDDVFDSRKEAAEAGYFSCRECRP